MKSWFAVSRCGGTTTLRVGPLYIDFVRIPRRKVWVVRVGFRRGVELSAHFGRDGVRFFAYTPPPPSEEVEV